ncbi:MAG: Ig-like domain-containing protein [Bacteroidota bacterium]|nr:MAG: Ig-like domain-containing protein [Bacteroidota bacterium]
MGIYRSLIGLCLVCLAIISCKPEENNPDYGILQLSSVTVGSLVLDPEQTTTNIPIDQAFVIVFTSAVDTQTIEDAIILLDESMLELEFSFTTDNNQKEIIVTPAQKLDPLKTYTLQLLNTLRGANKEQFSSITYLFQTNGILQIESIFLNGQDFNKPAVLQNVTLSGSVFIVNFSAPLNESNYKSHFSIVGHNYLDLSLSNSNKTVTATVTQDFESIIKYYFSISASLTSSEGYSFAGFNNYFYSAIDTTPKFPLISDEELLTLVQQQTFRFYWDYAHPVAGLSRERYGSGDIVTIGGSGFGFMSLIVGVERGFISRSQLLERLETILSFLETSDRFHGAWPHWINGTTGKVIPFSTNDNGADLVETSFLVQGLITMRQYLDDNDAGEAALIDRMNSLWQEVEWSWFTRDQNVLYWHWSPDKAWAMNMQIQGWSESLITYVLAASSPTYSITKEVYTNGWARNGTFPMTNGNTFYGITLPLSWDYGGPLFWAHYSFLGLDPRNLSDEFANYWEQNRAHSLINFEHCKRDPKQYIGYSAECWGLTACDLPNNNYGVSEPSNDRGVIAPTAAVSSIPYTPEESMDAIRYFYFTLGDKLWGDYGFYDAFDMTSNWWATSYISIDQGPQICMIENYRTGLLWDLFMSAPEIQSGLTKLGFTY